jgi:hypothetical protein
VSKAVVNRDLGRLYVEAKSFLKLRAQRNKVVSDSKLNAAKTPGPVVNAGA